MSTLSNPSSFFSFFLFIFFFYQYLEKHVSGTQNGFSSIYVMGKNFVSFYVISFWKERIRMLPCVLLGGKVLSVSCMSESEKPLVGHQS